MNYSNFCFLWGLSNNTPTRYSFDNDEFFKLLTRNESEISKLAESAGSAAEKIDLLSTEVLNAYIQETSKER